MNMSQSAHFVTQTSAYDRLLVGSPLTDKRITSYILQGRYGLELAKRQQRIEAWKAQVKQAKKKVKTLHLSDLI